MGRRIWVCNGLFFQGKVIHKVRAALNIRFRGDGKPSTVFVDRGQGFYAPRESKIIREFKKAFQETELKPYYGDNASAQPGNMQDVLLHETTVAWIRRKETSSRLQILSKFPKTQAFRNEGWVGVENSQNRFENKTSTKFPEKVSKEFAKTISEQLPNKPRKQIQENKSQQTSQ